MKDTEAVKNAIKERVTLGDLLRKDVGLTNAQSEEQFSCPFHGVDAKKSCRYYQETDTAYCWVCKEKWDIFSYVSKKHQINFTQAINVLIKAYRVDVSKLPDAIDGAHSRNKEIKRTATRFDPVKLKIEKLSQAIIALRGEIDFEKYKKIVFSFSLLKHMTPDEKKEATSEKLKEAILRLISE